MKNRIHLLATALIVLAAAGFFSGRHLYLHGERPRTVENITGEWFLRKFHATALDPGTDDEWDEYFSTEEHDTFFTLCFDTDGLGCIKFKREGPQIVNAWQYFWCLSGDTLVRWNKRGYEEYRIDRLTRSHLVLVIRRVNLQGETYESTYDYDRYR